MELSEESVMRALTEGGFEVEAIPTVYSEERADFRARYGDEEYIIEAKSRGMPEEYVGFIRRVGTDGYATLIREVKYWSSISKRLRKAGSQLSSTPATEGAFRIIWVFVAHADDVFVLDCVAKRLHGRRELAVIDLGAWQVTTMPCYYYDQNDFRRMEHVHAAVLLCSRGFQLLVNSFCPDRDRFRRGKLYQSFLKDGIVCDPEVLEEKGEAFLVGNDVTSSDESSWGYLKRRYGVQTSPMTEWQFNGLMSIDISRLQQ